MGTTILLYVERAKNYERLLSIGQELDFVSKEIPETETVHQPAPVSADVTNSRAYIHQRHVHLCACTSHTTEESGLKILTFRQNFDATYEPIVQRKITVSLNQPSRCYINRIKQAIVRSLK